MRQLSLLFLLLFTITNSFCQGKKVVLEEVEVKEKAIPEITILGIRYSYRERDFFIKTLLTQPFWRKDFKMKLDLSYFYKETRHHNQIGSHFCMLMGMTCLLFECFDYF